MSRLKSFGIASVALAVCLAGTAFRANATSLLVDQGSATLDPNSNLVWLDLTATQGLSYNDVMANNGVNYIQAGWRYATSTELSQLFTDVGLPGLTPVSSFVPNGSIYQGASLLLSLLGSTGSYTPGGSPFSTVYANGIVDSPFSGGHHAGYLEAGTDGTSYFAVSTYGTGYYNHIGTSDVGSFLVHDASTAVTPVPAALPLFLTALTGMGVIGRRRKARKHA